MNAKELRARLKKLSVPYSEELGIDVMTPQGRFRWLLASVLFGKRISASIATRTYAQFSKAGITSPAKILEAGWDRLVEILDAGGYVRYDFSTADRLLAIAEKLIREYGGRVDEIHRKAADSRDLERRLKEFPGIGDVTANIFLRELRTAWKKADPEPSQLVRRTAARFGVKLPDNRHSVAFVRLEAGLTRLAMEIRRKRKRSSLR
ncbi:MAG: hypothetical protein QW548_00520 [Candidatus Aenigmatarchaeota archaeon]